MDMQDTAPGQDLRIGEALADWTARRAHPIGLGTLARARWAVVDLLGCAIAGHRDASVTALTRCAKYLGTGDISALGTAHCYPAPVAALIGGTSAHVLDYDDTGATSIAHVSAVAVPAILALAEQEHRSLDTVLEAFVVGFEVTTRVGRMLNPEHYAAGWYATATAGLLGATAACARLLKLDARQTLAALSIATNLAGGSRRQIGSTMKATQAGIAAKNAVLAVRLAQAGTEGSQEPFLGEGGWLSLMAARHGPGAGAAALEGLGSAYALDAPELIQKFFPCCASAHKTLDAIAQLMASGELDARNVDRIDTWLTPVQRRNLRFDQPVGTMQARFSLPYCAARLLHGGSLRLGDFTPLRVADPQLAGIMARVCLHVQDVSQGQAISSGTEMTAALRTRVTLCDGTILERVVGTPKGSADNPMTQAERVAKFVDCCGYAGLAVDGENVLARIDVMFDSNVIAPKLLRYLSGLLADAGASHLD
ncbi:MmgE/PrpD family protein [Bordetella bronchiseptica F2]|nr:MmgE/PrpD family protein [Bordetella bronchiseptica F-1]KDC27613.1 MmgE/PrpD family protein [Bordetella bronchiseptica F2]KDC58731.1 MmgE/PrpD family protein [Bordetella bronchiseptica MBORD591]KDD47585.1 MmgE/PrpD family protein [Bordetella bronchiseptica MBORD901]